MGRRTGLAVGLVAGGILSLTFIVGFVAGTAFDRQTNASALSTSDPNLRDFLSAYQLVTQQSYYRPFNKRQLVYAAIDGMLNATGDPHTIFLSPPQNQSASTQLNGAQFSGIGAVVVSHGSSLLVLSPVPNQPAAQAGVRSGDLITKIDGRPVRGMSSDEAIRRIHGTAGSTVRLTIQRGKTTRLTVSVKRAVIPPITAYGRMLVNHIGELVILSFGDTTSAEVAQTLTQLRRQHVRGIVLDLRGNPGGYVEAAQQIVSDFIAHGVVAYEEGSNHQLTPLSVLPGKRVVNVPVAVLVDDQTASAAEITAAALRDDGGAVLIGTRTYGKGSMQSVYSLADGSTVRITDRLWLTPKKRSISNVGLQPTFFVAPGTFNSDPQLIRAERYLQHHHGS